MIEFSRLDRFWRGFLAGVVGGVVMNIFDLFSYNILHSTDLRYLDWATFLILGRPTANFAEATLGLFTNLMWTGILGIIIAYMIKFFSSQYYLFKGLVVAFFLFFMITAIPTVFGTEFLREITFNTAKTHLIGSLLWGLATAYVLKILDEMHYKESPQK